MNIIEIVGLPGSGKTTLARILARKLGYAYFDVDLYLENPFLPLVAREPEKYALAAGLQFSLTRANRIVPLQKLSRRKNVVLDQGFHMGFYMYTKNHYAGTGILGEKEYKLLKAVHERLMEQAPAVSTTIVLDYPTPLLMERLTTRGRAHEKLYTKTQMDQWRMRLSEHIEDLINQKKRKSVVTYTYPGAVDTAGKQNKTLEHLIYGTCGKSPDPTAKTHT
jgi:deoxyadenosine/deoxycytidine kinase